MEQLVNATAHRAPRNKGKLVGQKAPFKLGEIWAILLELHVDPQRIRPCAQLAGRCFVVLAPEVHEAEIIPGAVVGDPFLKDPPGDSMRVAG